MKEALGDMLAESFKNDELVEDAKTLIGVAAMATFKDDRFDYLLGNLFKRALLKQEVFSHIVETMVTNNLPTMRWFKSGSPDSRARELQKVYSSLFLWRESEIASLDLR